MLNIQTDSRKIKKGDIFVAVKCEVNDGHAYVEKAIENGASKVVVERGEYSVPTEIVPDTREYLKKYLKENYDQYVNEMTLIGITGTNGKTTSSYLLYQALNALGIKTAYIGTIGFYLEKRECLLPNTSVDLCDTYDLLMKAYDKGFKTVVLETSSHALYNKRLDILSFDYAVFTNLTQDHLDYHKTMENYAKAKEILFTKLKQNGKAIINMDDPNYQRFSLKDNKNIFYGINHGDVKIIDYNMNSNGTEFTYEYQNKKNKLMTKLVGKYNLYNLLVCLTILLDMKIDEGKIKRVFPKLECPNGRMDKINFENKSIIIDYAHTPDAIEKIISTVKEFTKGNIYVVFGCTGDRDRGKRPIMMDIVTKNAKYAVVTNDDPHNEDEHQIVNDMLNGIEKNNYEICLDRKKAIHKGISLLKEDDALLILGKGHEEFMIIKDKKIPFNDKNVVLEYLEEKCLNYQK